MKDKKTNKLLILLLSGIIILLVIAVAIGINASYSFYGANEGTISNNLAPVESSLACFDISLTGGINEVSTNNKYPITDSYALNNTIPVEALITNNCNTPLEYSIILSTFTNNSNYIEDSKIRTQILLDEGNINDYEIVLNRTNNNEIDYISRLPKLSEGPNYNYILEDLRSNSSLTNLDRNNSYILNSRTIEANSSDKYKVYLWVDYYEGDSDVYDYQSEHDKIYDNSTQNKLFKGAITVAIDVTKENVTGNNTITINNGDSVTDSDIVELTLNVGNEAYKEYCISNYDTSVGCQWNKITNYNEDISVPNRLPNEYQEVEYIESQRIGESSGTYIDSGIIATNISNMKAYVDFSCSKQPGAISDGTTYWIFGTHTSTGVRFSFKISRNYYNGYLNSSEYQDLHPRDNKRHNAVVDLVVGEENGTITIDDNKYNVITSEKYRNNNSIEKSIYIFAGHYLDLPVYGVSNEVRLYSLKFELNNKIIRSFIPCIRKIDNKPGLYDTVNGVFYTNQGEGEFLYGSEVYHNHQLSFGVGEKNVYVYFKDKDNKVTTPISDSIIYDIGISINKLNDIDSSTTPKSFNYNKVPLEYQEVEYIESTGTQWISTNIFPDSNTGVYVKFMPLISGDALVVGAKGGSYSYSVGYNSANMTIYSSWNANDSISERPTYSYNQVYETSMNYFNDKKRITNNVEGTNITTSLDNIAYPIHIFGYNKDGVNSLRSICKLYSVIITNNNNMSYKFVPCYRKSDNKSGLYDTVNGEFYTNQGTGEFLYGPNVYNANLKNLIEVTYTSGYKVSNYCLSKSNNSCDSNWISINGKAGTDKNIYVEYNESGKYYIHLKDINGRISYDTTGIDVIYDVTKPTAVVNEVYKNGSNTSINFTATDTQSKLVSYCIQQVNDIVGCSWKNITNKSLNVTMDSYTFVTKKRHFLFVKDEKGNISDGVSFWVNSNN